MQTGDWYGLMITRRDGTRITSGRWCVRAESQTAEIESDGTAIGFTIAHLLASAGVSADRDVVTIEVVRWTGV